MFVLTPYAEVYRLFLKVLLSQGDEVIESILVKAATSEIPAETTLTYIDGQILRLAKSTLVQLSILKRKTQEAEVTANYVSEPASSKRLNNNSSNNDPCLICGGTHHLIDCNRLIKNAQTDFLEKTIAKRKRSNSPTNSNSLDQDTKTKFQLKSVKSQITSDS